MNSENMLDTRARTAIHRVASKYPQTMTSYSS